LRPRHKNLLSSAIELGRQQSEAGEKRAEKNSSFGGGRGGDLDGAEAAKKLGESATAGAININIAIIAGVCISSAEPKQQALKLLVAVPPRPPTLLLQKALVTIGVLSLRRGGG